MKHKKSTITLQQALLAGSDNPPSFLFSRYEGQPAPVPLNTSAIAGTLQSEERALLVSLVLIALDFGLIAYLASLDWAPAARQVIEWLGL